MGIDEFAMSTLNVRSNHGFKLDGKRGKVSKTKRKQAHKDDDARSQEASKSHTKSRRRRARAPCASHV